MVGAAKQVCVVSVRRCSRVAQCSGLDVAETIRGNIMSSIGSFVQQRLDILRCKPHGGISALAVAGLIAAGGAANVQAQSPSWNAASGQSASPASVMPRSALFVGLGGSYNSVDFGDQHIFAQGVSNIYQNGLLVAFGAAGGSTDPYLDARSTLAPTAQVGFFHHLGSSKWMWGAKFSYSYLEATSTAQNVTVPQAGSFTSNNSDTFAGNVLIRAYQASIHHQMTLMPLVGRSFERGFVYFGAGPSLSQVQTNLDGVIGFADINGSHTNITGTPSNFSSSPWVYGAAATIGATYFLDRSWFLDLNYAYARTKTGTSSFSGPFASTTSGYTDTGILSGTYSGEVITQSFTISINRAF
jgi:hypothetical protein